MVDPMAQVKVWITILVMLAFHANTYRVVLNRDRRRSEREYNRKREWHPSLLTFIFMPMPFDILIAVVVVPPIWYGFEGLWVSAAIGAILGLCALFGLSWVRH